MNEGFRNAKNLYVVAEMPKCCMVRLENAKILYECLQSAKSLYGLENAKSAYVEGKSLTISVYCVCVKFCTFLHEGGGQFPKAIVWG